MEPKKFIYYVAMYSIDAISLSPNKQDKTAARNTVTTSCAGCFAGLHRKFMWSNPLWRNGNPGSAATFATSTAATATTHYLVCV
jgi:hypothetical protein